MKIEKIELIQEIRKSFNEEENKYRYYARTLKYKVNDKHIVPKSPKNTLYKQVREAIKNGMDTIPQFTDNDILEYAKNEAIKELKAKREKLTNEIVVTLDDGNMLNGDETSQTRFTRAINALTNDTDTISWIDYNNQVIQLNRLQFKEALNKAGELQTQIYFTYSQYREQVKIATLDNIGVIIWD